MNSPSPAPAGHLVLGTYLRHRRLARGLTAERVSADLAREQGMSLSVPVLSRIESGQRPASEAEAATLLRTCRCSRTESFSRGRRQLGDTTYATGGPVQLPVVDSVAGWQDRLAAVEHRANRARFYSQFLIPAFLRTDAYAALVEDGLPEPQIGRPGVLGAGTVPVVILDASLFSRPWGGANLFTAQVQHLLNAMGTGRLDLRILPVDRNVHPPAHQLTEYHLQRGLRPHAAERASGVAYYAGSDNAARLGAHLDRAADQTLGPADSRRHLERARAAASQGGLPPPC
ncbi:Scr1 family TA system antitoxin-like transcriptional regulator [Streptomyces microflavus]|uniref:Scr1 family TA system antitoxin-like transcriptional regulator n=1 Tax=Streptomyces microflavus TaxID=1919 RepID=UPI003650582A